METRIKLFLVEDHPLFALGLQSMLETNEGLEVVGAANNAPDALRDIAKLMPDIVLADISMPGISGIELLKRLRKERPDVKVIMLTAFEDEKLELEAFRFGAWAYLNKTAPNDEIVSTIRTVHDGKKVLNDRQSTVVLNQFEQLSESNAQTIMNLSAIDLRVLALLAEGKNYAEIAQKINASETTVKRIVASLLTKMGASNRTHAVSLAMRYALI